MSTMEAKREIKHPIRRKARSRGVRQTQTTDAVPPASSDRIGEKKEPSPFKKKVKISLQPSEPEDSSDANVGAATSMLSPRPRGKVLPTAAKRTTPRGRSSSSSIANYVITPHTPQERDVGLTLAALARNANVDEDPSTDGISPGSRVTYSLTFPELVHKMVTETVERNSQAIRWMHDGEAFLINPKNKKLGKVLHKYFRHGKYGSLQRQLNMYGWKKQIVGKYTGCFYNPEFHRDTDLSKIARIKRRGPPVKVRKAKNTSPPTRQPSKRVVSVVRKDLMDSDTDDEWEPPTSAKTVPDKKPLFESAREGGKQLVVPVSIQSAATETPGVALSKPRSIFTPIERLFEKSIVPSSRAARHPGAALPTPSRGRLNMTPGNFKDGIMNFDYFSPSTPLSPFMGRSIRQESNGVMPTASAQQQPSEAPWDHWYQMSGFQWPQPFAEGMHPPRAAGVTGWNGLATARSFQMTASAGLSSWAESPLEVATGLSRDPPSPAEVFSSTYFGPNSLRPPLAPVPPLLSRDNSAAFAPVPLVQRISSSFYLPFVGLADTLASALASSPVKVAVAPSTPLNLPETV